MATRTRFQTTHHGATAPPPGTPPAAPRPPTAPADPTPASRKGGDGSRAGAVWVAGTGAFLLLVSAAVFVAARWDHIPDGFKLAAIGLMTGAFLLVGRSVRSTLPGTGGAMYHLGAFLIPIDIAAIGVHVQLGLSEILLVQGTICAVAFWLLDRAERSVLLRWATAAAVPVATAGLAGVTDTPFALLMAGGSAIALLLNARRAAVAWAVVAGFAPLLAGVDASNGSAAQVLADSGMVGSHTTPLALASGAIAASVLGIEAHRRRDPGLALLAAISVAIGTGQSWLAAQPGSEATFVALAGAFVAIEVAALLARRDPFWSRQANVAAVAAEMLSGLASLSAIAILALTSVEWIPIDESLALAFGLTAIGWFIADLRRRAADSLDIGSALLLGAGWSPSTFYILLTASAGAALVGGPTASAVVLTAGAAAVVVSARPLCTPIAVVATSSAALIAWSQPWLAVALGASGAAVLTYAALLRARQTTAGGPPEPAWVLAALVPAPLLAASVTTSDLPTTAVLVATAAVLWASGLLLDRGQATPSMNGLGLVGRGYAVATVLWTINAAPSTALILSAFLVAIALTDVAVRRDWRVAATGWVTLPVLVTAATLQFGGTREEALAHLLLASGAAGIGAGVLSRNMATMAAGTFVLTLGVWSELALADVEAMDAYVAPVALGLGLAGIAARRARPDDVSSWVAYVAPIALMGGAALVERVDGGSGTHALVAGAVGLAAVAVGGWRRLAGPLFVGTVLLVTTVGYESLAVTAGVPTWVWLALGGTTLLGVGIAMERTATGPIDGGRRLVDIISDRFE